jgi:hypothetical protein
MFITRDSFICYGVRITTKTVTPYIELLYLKELLTMFVYFQPLMKRRN